MNQGSPVDSAPSALHADSKFARGVGQTSVGIFLLAMLIPVRGLSAIAPSLGGWPVNSVALGMIGFLGLFAAKRWDIKQPLLVIPGVLLPVWVIGSTWLIHGDESLRRPLNMAVLALGVAVIATGRVHLPSLLRGLTIGLFVSATISAALAVTQSTRMSGLLGDANQAGFVVVTLGLLVLQWLGDRRQRWLVFGILGITLLLTLSRTSMFALLVGVLWALFGFRLNRFLGGALLALAVPLYSFLVNLMEARGWFPERDGSDALREQLRGIEDQLVQEAGWIGNGLGTAVAEVSAGRTLFFHNSYNAMRAEGGVIALAMLVAVLAGLYVMGGKVPSAQRPAWAEAAVIAACICSMNIGFSITHPVMAVALGSLIAMNAAHLEGVDWAKDPVRTARRI